MWVMMYICYLLMGMTFLMVLLTGLQGFFQFHILGAAHPRFALATILVYLFAETQIMFFFIGSAKKVKEYLKLTDGDRSLYAPLIKIKMTVFPHITSNMIFTFTLFWTGGSVDRGSMPGWLHGILFLGVLGHLAWTTVLEHRAFKTNTEIVLKMYGVEREPQE